MARRYGRAPILRAGKMLGTTNSTRIVREGVEDGRIRLKETRKLRGGERLDSIAGKEYGRSDYYWIIAAASKIGWSLQVPPGTEIKIPILEDVEEAVG